MGFFSSIGNFISQNVQSAVNDVTHVVSQVAPLAIGALPSLIPGGSIVTSLLGGLGSTGGQPQTPSDNSASDAINQLNANQQALATQNAQLANQLANLNTPAPSAVTNSFMDNVKKYWYFIAIPFVAIGAFFIFKPKNSRYGKR